MVRAGLVPYWYESATCKAATTLEWWLAGSDPFASIDVLVEPSGVPTAAAATYRQWTAIAHTGATGAVDPGAVGDYTTFPTATRHATHLLRRHLTNTPSKPLPVHTAVDMIGNMAATGELPGAFRLAATVYGQWNDHHCSGMWEVVIATKATQPRQTRRAQEPPFRKPRWHLAYSFGLITGALFLLSWLGQFIFQIATVSNEASEHGQSFS